GSAGLVLVPTGAGTPTPLPRGDVAEVLGARFFPDGRRIAFVDTPAGKPARIYTQEIPNGTPRLFNAGGYGSSGKPISPDGTEIVVFRDWQEDLFVLPLGGGPPRAIPNTKQLDPVGWTPDRRSIYAMESGSVPARILRIDVATGARTPFETLSATSIPTVLAIRNPLVTADGRGYAFGYSSPSSSDLYVVEIPK
ncbi:MAG TPA: hypothetical protein VFL12_11430, partial [Thermoanaerobaculia bacterium]|nr:hypothetical protein [Thermoanaerobaculia bacterium]